VLVVGVVVSLKVDKTSASCSGCVELSRPGAIRYQEIRGEPGIHAQGAS